MCGIFGFITSEGKGPDIARLRKLALVTQTRGTHAFGLAWLDREGKLHTFKRPGPAACQLDVLEACREASIVVGHCRLATHGSPTDNRNNHPHRAGSGYLVHNGVVHNHQELARYHRLDLQSQCDSEVLGLLLAKARGTIAQRSVWMAQQVQGDLALLGIWHKPGRLLIARRGRPLCYGGAGEGYYFASLAEGLPGKVQKIAEGSTRVLILRHGELQLEGPSLALPESPDHSNRRYALENQHLPTDLANPK
jgi:glucosamine 6-phosphate synthetase-like amidotransferase/phosphosugar isomerase protein